MAKKTTKPKRATEVRDRMLPQIKVRAGDLAAVQDHPLNWREHGDEQTRTLDDLLGVLGCVKAIDVYIPKPDDSYVTEGIEVAGVRTFMRAGVPCIMDGHLRRKRLPPEFMLTLNVTDLTQDEARLYLLTCDPVAGLAGQDDERLVQLLATTDSDSAAVQAMLADLVDMPADPEAGDDDGDGPEGKFQIIVTCKDEDEQRVLIERFLSEGIEHKAVMS